MNTQEAIETIKNIDTLYINDRITGQQVDMVNKNQVLDVINQINGLQKPRVPKVAVEFYEQYKDKDFYLGEWFGDFYSREAIEEFPRMNELSKWLHDNDRETDRQREFALAMLVTFGIDAVEVEKEKLYTVEIPNPNKIGNEKNVLMMNDFRQVVIVKEYGDNWKKENGFRLTKLEIKKDFDWALKWAEPVEE